MNQQQINDLRKSLSKLSSDELNAYYQWLQLLRNDRPHALALLAEAEQLIHNNTK